MNLVIKLSFWALVLVTVLGACTFLNNTPTPMPTTITNVTTEPYPVGAAAAATAYPFPVDQTPPDLGVVYAVPTPGADTGVVIGKLIDQETKEPLAGQTVYLAVKVWMTPGPDYTYGIQEKSSPHTMTDSQGRFAIGDVPSGDYVLMLWTPFSVTVAMDARGDAELEVKAQLGEILDLGEIEALNPMNPSTTP